MWICPKCGREFKNKNPAHYCGDKPKNIDEYILSQDEEKRESLMRMREILSRALPDVRECISWSMPTFRQGHNTLNFAASQNHIGFYPGVDAVAHFADELNGYRTDKVTVRIPYDKLYEELITEIAKWCLDTENHA